MDKALLSLVESLSGVSQESRLADLPDDDLIRFTERTYPQYKAEPAHHLIAAKLMQVVRGECKRLMIAAPPQHGKSELTSVRFPAYWLGHRPNDPVLLASYGAKLAEDKGGQARDTVDSEVYRGIFPGMHVKSNARASSYWKLSSQHRGFMLSVGVGGPITGRGGLLGIIDDPFENWKQAQSPTHRETVWNWWRATFRTRIWEGGAIVLIMTRWHEDDLAGRLLQTQGDRWDVVRLPALAESQEQRDESNRVLGLPQGKPDPLGREPGAPLCPKRFSKPALVEISADVGSMAWSAEYQGVPRAPEGNNFKRHWFSIVGSAPHEAKRVRYWDKAATEGGGAFTAGVLMALADGIIYIEDVKRGQWSAHERNRIIKQTAELDALKYGGNSAVHIWVEQEPGSGGKESAEFTIRQLAGFVVKKEPVSKSGDKLVRSQPLQSYAEGLNVRLVRGLWNQTWLDEITAVPNNKYWDQLDASAGGFNKLVGRDRRAKKGKVSRKRAGR